MTTISYSAKEHREGLINVYKNFLEGQISTFQRLIFERAIKKLKAKADPTKVENWVIEMERLWMKLDL